MTPLRMAVIGVGHLGRHHARILAADPRVCLVAVVDTRLEQAEAVAARCGEPTRVVTDYRTLLDPTSAFGPLDAVVVAVPTTWHTEVAGAFLERGIAALVEKPLARTADEAEHLVTLAERNRTTLQVGHIERFNPALQAVVASKVRPRYLEAERRGIYTFRSTDIGVVFDLMVHDLDIVASLVPSPVRSVEAVGLRVLSDFEDVANARIQFEDGTVATVTANRTSYVPARTLRIWSDQGYLRLDFAQRSGTIVRPTEALRRRDLGLDGIDIRNADQVRAHLFGTLLEVDHVEAGDLLGAEADREPLALELDDFVEAIRTGRRPRVDGHDGLRAVRLAEQVLQSMQQHAWADAESDPPKLAQAG